MGAFMSFKYKNDFGKVVGHTLYVYKQGDLEQVLERYHLVPSEIFDIKMNGSRLKDKPITDREEPQYQKRYA